MKNSSLELLTASLQQTVWPILIALAVFLVLELLVAIFIKSRIVRLLILFPALIATLYFYFTITSRAPVIPREQGASQERASGATVDGVPVKLR